MSNILLINPYYSQPLGYYSFYKPSPPRGLMSIATYLEDRDTDCEIIELGIFDESLALMCDGRIRFGVSDDKIRAIIKEKQPKIVGISCMYSVYFRDVLDIALTIKKVNPKIKIILGGNHASAYKEQILKNKCIDYVVAGEGEKAFFELCWLIELGIESFNDVDTSQLPSDKIPFPAYHKIKLEDYLEKDNIFCMRLSSLGIISSRGCPNNCVYCTVKAVWGRSWRGIEAGRVVDELEYLHKSYGIMEFAFLDDSASLDKKRWLAICKGIKERKLNIKWTTPNGIAHWTLDKETLLAMKEAGCYRITFGIESGHWQTRKYIGKNYDLNQAKELIQYANKIGMWTICTFIIGFPQEMPHEMEATYNYAISCGTDFACFYLLIPQPTSDVYKDFRKLGLLNFDKFFNSPDFDIDEFEKINLALNETGCETLYFSKEELQKKQKSYYRRFLISRIVRYILNPLLIIRKVRSWEEFVYVLRLAKASVRIFNNTTKAKNQRTGDYLYE